MKSNKSLSKKVLASVLAGTAVLTFAVASYMPASANDDTAQVKTEAVSNNRPHRLGAKMNPVNERVNQAVKDGKITSEQATKLKNAMDEFKQKQKAERKEFMKSLPDKTGISQATLKEIFKKPNKFVNRQNRLATLVQNGQVTQQEADSLNKFFASHKPGSANAPKSHEEAMQQMTSETGISADRIKQIMKLMRPPMGPGPVMPKNQ